MRAGPESDAVVVTGNSSPLQTDDASEGYQLGSGVVDSLPLSSRNIIELVTLGPGAIPRQLGGFTHDIINDKQANRGAVALNPPVNGARSYRQPVHSRWRGQHRSQHLCRVCSAAA